MDPKKNVLSKLRDFKLFNVKKKKKTPLKYRRSISVPDLSRSSPVMANRFDQIKAPDSTADLSFIEETSSVAYSDNLSVTDVAFSAWPTDQLQCPDTPSSTSSRERHTAPDTQPLTQLLPRNTSADKACLINRSPFPSTPSATKVLDQFTFPDTPSSARHTVWDVPPTSDSPAVVDNPTNNDMPDKKAEKGDRKTKWYIDDQDSDSESDEECSEQEITAAIDLLSPGSTDMCVSGSAEDIDEVPNESSDYDTSVSGGEKKVHYVLTINLKEGKNLVIRDRTGTSDPFVKFKVDGKTVYKSKVVHRNLNPTWNESFSFPIRDLEQSISVQVYDRDLRSHDFMGSNTISLSKLELEKTCEIILPLEDTNSPENDMGVIVLDACVAVSEEPAKRTKWPLKRKGSFNKGQPQQARGAATQKCQLWSEVYTVVLVEGQDMPDGGEGDMYVLFSLGEQRYRSKNLCIKANPQWRERFDFNRFDDGQSDKLMVEIFCKRGRKREERWGMQEYDLSELHLNKKHSYTHTMGAGKGRLVFLVTRTPCPGASISDLRSALSDISEETLQQYSLTNTLLNLQDVGYLQVKVVRATDLSSTDLNGKSDPFCMLELGNSKLQTQTMYKTLNPEWRTMLTFPIRDIHEVLELSVFGEDGDKSGNFLGKVAIPLLTVSNGQQITSLLKKEDLTGPSKGSITLEMNVVYNPVRAAIRTFKPKEKKFVEDNPKFNKKLLARNIYRVRRISMAVLYTLQYINSCFQWESTQRSVTAFLIFVVMVCHFELFMLPLFLLLLIGWNYFHNTPGAGSHSQDLESMSVAEDEDEDEKESEKRGLMEKIHMVQEIVLTVQNVLDEVACIGERVKNTFNWSVPFLSFLASAVLFTATAALYYIPFRYIVLLWGVQKFSKKLIYPNAIDNNELLDFLKRVPSDVQKVQYSELRTAGTQSAQKKKR
ncbi:multiple C2 and transmembrane domain-containing protein 2 [Astyanax mexicanus]|uniref:multiple C2 and transmembrane domain-containing protein 2 n=1 Tax=Astyanax mexicanus TaxID=7994 RepID=UPI0020CB41DF|nr:multiple C2 and transmembrane domain-containing protein 2 [Astyanax mexicanus]